jgi:antitoxin MazE
MRTKIQKWGNSQGVRLSKELLSNIEIEIGDPVEIAVQKGTLILKPLRRIRGGHNLRALVQRIPDDYKAEEVDWGIPVGGEAW